LEGLVKNQSKMQK